MRHATYLAELLTVSDAFPRGQREAVRLAAVPSTASPAVAPLAGFPPPTGPQGFWEDTDQRTFTLEGEDRTVGFAPPPGTTTRLLVGTIVDDPLWNAWPTHRAMLRHRFQDALDLATNEPVDREQPSTGTLLMLAVEADFLALVERLLAAGANPNRVTQSPRSVVHGLSPLAIAAHTNRLHAPHSEAILRALLDAGGDLRYPTDQGQPMLHHQPQEDDDMDRGHAFRGWSHQDLLDQQVAAERRQLRAALATVPRADPAAPDPTLHAPSRFRRL